jgi:hypothetical protein
LLDLTVFTDDAVQKSVPAKVHVWLLADKQLFADDAVHETVPAQELVTGA